MTAIIIFLITIVWIALAIIPAFMARDKGYSGAGFFLLALFISFLLSIIIILVLPVRSEILDKKQLQAGSHRKCPYCAESVKTEAKICKHCGRDVAVALAGEAEADRAKNRERVAAACSQIRREELDFDSYALLAQAAGASLKMYGGLIRDYTYTRNGKMVRFSKYKKLRPYFLENVLPLLEVPA